MTDAHTKAIYPGDVHDKHCLCDACMQADHRRALAALSQAVVVNQEAKPPTLEELARKAEQQIYNRSTEYSGQVPSHDEMYDFILSALQSVQAEWVRVATDALEACDDLREDPTIERLKELVQRSKGK